MEDIFHFYLVSQWLADHRIIWKGPLETIQSKPSAHSSANKSSLICKTGSICDHTFHRIWMRTIPFFSSFFSCVCNVTSVAPSLSGCREVELAVKHTSDTGTRIQVVILVNEVTNPLLKMFCITEQQKKSQLFCCLTLLLQGEEDNRAEMREDEAVPTLLKKLT